MNSTTGAGRPATCATETQPRCLQFDKCTGCKKWKKTQEREERQRKKIELEIRNKISAEVPNTAPPEPPAAQRSEMPTPQVGASPFKRVIESPHIAKFPVQNDQHTMVMATISETPRTTPKIPTPALLRPACVDWSTFGGPDPTPPPTEEEEAEQEAQEARAERVANPSPMAHAAALGIVKLVKACGAEMESMGRPWPAWGNEAAWGPVFAVLGASALESASILLPNIEQPDWACHAVTGTAIVASVGSVYVARKSPRVDSGRRVHSDKPEDPESNPEPQKDSGSLDFSGIAGV